MSAHKHGLDALAGDWYANPEPTAAQFSHRPPWWHQSAIVIGALASMATLLMTYMTLSHRRRV